MTYTKQEILQALERVWIIMDKAYMPSAAGAILCVAKQLELEELFKEILKNLEDTAIQ